MAHYDRWQMLRPVEVLLLDEITTDLDVITRADFLAFLRHEAECNGATIVYATHIFDGLAEVRSTAGRATIAQDMGRQVFKSGVVEIVVVAVVHACSLC